MTLVELGVYSGNLNPLIPPKIELIYPFVKIKLVRGLMLWSY